MKIATLTISSMLLCACAQTPVDSSSKSLATPPSLIEHVASEIKLDSYGDWSAHSPTSSEIHYYGRWDFSDPLRPSSSWPGTALEVKFTGTRVGIRSIETNARYNIYIDGQLKGFFYTVEDIDQDYTLADNLTPGEHTLKISKRNFSMDSATHIGELLLEPNGQLVESSPTFSHRIEFIGDSYTSAVGNEATGNPPWDEVLTMTNIDNGFPRFIADYLNAQIQVNSRAGFGVLMDWEGNTQNTLPLIYDHVFSTPDSSKWDAKNWQPELVIVGLGLNDYSGLGGWKGSLSEDKAKSYREAYLKFIETLRAKHPHSQFLLVAPYVEWLRSQIKQIVDIELAKGYKDTYYAQYDYFEGGYVADGHPNTDSHKKMAEQIIQAIKTNNIFKEK